MRKMMSNTEGLRDLLIFMMVHDEPSIYNTKALYYFLNELAKDAGFEDWIEAYHKL